MTSKCASFVLFGKFCEKNHFFVCSQPAALQQLTSLYVSRSKTVWRDTDILPWLSQNVNTVLDRVDAKDPIINEYSTKRSQRYVSVFICSCHNNIDNIILY